MSIQENVPWKAYNLAVAAIDVKYLNPLPVKRDLSLGVLL